MRFACRTIRIHQRGRLVRTAKLTGLVGGELGLCGAWIDSALLGAASLALLGVAMSLVTRALTLRTLVSAGEIEVDEGLLSARSRSGGKAWPLSRIESAFRLERSAASTTATDLSEEVAVTTRDGDALHLRLEGAGAAAGLLEALGFGPKGRTVRFPIAGPAGSAPLGYGLALLMMGFFGSLAAVGWTVGVLLPSANALLLATVSTATTGLTWVLARPRAVEVGTDGVTVHGCGPRSYYAYRDLEIARPGRAKIALRLADGRRVPLVAAVGDERTFASLQTHLERAWRRAAEPRSEAHLEDKPVASTAFRARELDVEDLSSILEDPRLPVAQRIEAARLLCARDPVRGARAARAVAEASCDAGLQAELVRLAG